MYIRECVCANGDSEKTACPLWRTLSRRFGTYESTTKSGSWGARNENICLVVKSCSMQLQRKITSRHCDTEAPSWPSSNSYLWASMLIVGQETGTSAWPAGKPSQHDA